MRLAQVVHAAGESVKFPILAGCHAVCLEVDSEAELWTYANRFERAKIQHHLVVEVDEPYEGQLMAIGLEPTRDRSLIRRLTSSLRLAR